MFSRKFPKYFLNTQLRNHLRGLLLKLENNAFIFHLIQLWQTLPFPNVLLIFIWWVVINLTDFWNSAKNREPTRDNLSCKIQFWRVTFSIHPVQTTRMSKVIWRSTRNGMNRWSPQVLKEPWRTLEYYKFRVLSKPSK